MLQLSAWSKAGIEVVDFASRLTEALEDSISGFNESDVRKRFEEVGGKWQELNNGDFESYDGSHLDYNSAEKLSK